MGVCGDGVVEGGEECDNGPNNNDLLQGACRSDCTAAGCGDAVVDYVLGEECDDGNAMAGDGCSDSCGVEVGNACGDGKVIPAEGEECDDGNKTPGDGCSATCQFEVLGAMCGDGGIDMGEVCDDGGLINGDACNPTCNLKNTTKHFLGQVGQPGFQDGAGMSARIGGAGTLAVDNTYLYLADSMNRRVRRITIANATIQTIAGSGQMGDVDNMNGLMAQLGGIEAITTDGNRLWITSNRKIKEIALSGQFPVKTVAGSGAMGLADGVGPAAQFDDPRGLTYYAGFVYLLDANGAVLRRFDPATNEVLTLAGQPYQTGNVDGVGNAARFTSPRYMASDNSGVLYIADTNGFHIRTYNIGANYVGTFAGTGMAGYVDGVGTNAAIHRPRGMTSDGTSIYFTEFNQHTIRQGILATQDVSTNVGQHCNGMMCNGGYTEGVGTASRWSGPFSVVYHSPSDSLFVVDSGNAVIRRIQ